MKLRNKKTGEIIEWFNNTGNIFPDTLAELNEEWEDYKEQKEYWYIAELCGGLQRKQDTDNGEDRFNKEIGNYFETKEEAEKAVEKLKAWKRLKDKGLRFNKWTIPEEPKTSHIKLVIEGEMDVPNSPYDLDLLFGGEETCSD